MSMTALAKLAERVAEVLPPKPLGDVRNYAFIVSPQHSAELHNRFARLADAIATLAEPGEVEAVAWLRMTPDGKPDWAEDCIAEDSHFLDSDMEAEGYYLQPLYTTPRAAEAVTEVSENEVRSALADHVGEYGSQKEFAQHGANASESYVTDVLHGRRAVPEKWVAILGYRMAWVKDANNRTTVAALTPPSAKGEL